MSIHAVCCVVTSVIYVAYFSLFVVVMFFSPGAESYGRLVFRKPTKRSSDTNTTVLSASSVSKKAKSEKDGSPSLDSSAEPTAQTTDRTAEKVKPNSSLLSFNDDDDDDDDDS